jgi:hypothetical protein
VFVPYARDSKFKHAVIVSQYVSAAAVRYVELLQVNFMRSMRDEPPDPDADVTSAGGCNVRLQVNLCS